METRFPLRPPPPPVRPWLAVAGTVLILVPAAAFGVWLAVTAGQVPPALILPFALFGLPLLAGVARLFRKRPRPGDLVVDDHAIAIPAMGDAPPAEIPLAALATVFVTKAGLVVGGDNAVRFVPAACFAPAAAGDAERAIHEAIARTLGLERLARITLRAEAGAAANAQKPWATIGVGIAVAALFVLELVSGALTTETGLDALGAARRGLVLEGQVWRLVTGPLLHAGLLHIAMNGAALYAIGPVLERWLGKGRFLLLLLGSALVGAVASVLARDIGTVGISGGLFGLLGALMVSTVRYRKAPMLGPRLTTRSWVMLIVVNVAISAIPGVDAVAHGVGFAVGAAVAALVIPRLGGDPPARKRPLVPVKAATVAGYVLAALYAAGVVAMLVHLS